MATEPRYRPASRLIILDARDRILLVQLASDFMGEPPFWITPGGGLDPGESYEEAALRELWEETGISGVEVGPCVWIRRHAWPWFDEVIDSEEHFYIVRVDRVDAAPQKLEGNEAEVWGEMRWWSNDEIDAATDEVFAPIAMGALLRPLLAGEFPAEPIAVGA
ncbi:MAG: NUDIX domain-containing protein [Dehalococcoidia bacterium]